MKSSSLDLNLSDLERGQGSGAFKTVDWHCTKVQKINQVKLRGYSSNKRHLYTGDRGKSIYSKGAVCGKVGVTICESRCVGVEEV
jgi:hypothetical protein